MKVLVNKGVFFTISEYSEKDTIKSCGFRWNPNLKRWETTDIKVVEKLINVLSNEPSEHGISPEVKEIIKERKQKMENVLQKSMSATSDISIPSPSGLVYMPFQKAGVDFINQQKNVLVADEMGLGKTIQAIGYINLNPEVRTVLIICPASLKFNWKSELQKWLVRPYSVDILNGHGLTDITITNYESVKKYFSELTSQKWDLLVLDESHYIKNYKAQRTQYITGFYEDKKNKTGWVTGLKDYAKQKILLTGTPILNRPMELFTQLKVLGNEMGKNPFGFRDRYVETDRWGGDRGTKNLEELQMRLRTTCMIRREKKDVLLELPDKLRQVITLPTDVLSETDREESRKIVNYLSESWDIATQKLTKSEFDFEEISKIRHKQSVKKIPYVLEHLENVLENEDKIVVFAHHHDVIDAIYEKFKNISVVGTGNETLKERDEAVTRFQNDPNVKLFIGSIQAMGVGITLTSASTVIFAEIEWRPGDLSQAEDRLHRIGQKSTVLVQYLVVNDSIDSYMINKILEKMGIIEQITDAAKVQMPEEISVSQFSETVNTVPSKQEIVKEYVSDELVAPVLRSLKTLSQFDLDGARFKNDIGFNGTDSDIGHSLAMQDRLTPKQYDLAKKILKKYHRKLNSEDYRLIYGEVVTEGGVSE
jgi:SWI/SNF-related matrix-associated actin-dependent regulator 1 of chromatin subfamily A